MRRPVVYSPLGAIAQAALIFLVLVVVAILLLGAFRSAFTRIGFSWNDALFVLVFSYLGSHINIPVRTLRSDVRIISASIVRVWGVPYRVPVQAIRHQATVVAVNVGGCVIPVAVAIYLLARFPEAIPYAVAGTVAVALVVNRVAAPVEGVGIVTPFLTPPLAAAIVTLAMVAVFGASPSTRFVLAYVSGTMGALIGADIMNLGRIGNLGAPVASIGGAGTFDGVFITGIFAVLLV